MLSRAVGGSSLPTPASPAPEVLAQDAGRSPVGAATRSTTGRRFGESIHAGRLRRPVTYPIAALVAAILLTSCTHGGTATTTTVLSTTTGAPSRTATFPTGGEKVLASIAMPSPGSVETGFGSVWVANGPAQTVTRLNPQSNAVIATIPTPDVATVVAVGAGAIWLTSFPGNSLTRIDPASNRVTRTISLSPKGAGAIGVTIFDGFVWVANHNGTPTTSVSKIDPATMRVVDVIRVGSQTQAGPVWILHSAGSIWTNVNGDQNVIFRIDPRSDRILAAIPAPGACTQLAAADTAVWGASGDDGSCPPGVSRIDTRTNKVAATFDEGGAANAVALSQGSLWYGTTTTHELGRIDPRTNKVVSVLDLPGPAFGMTVGAKAIWVTDRDDGELFKVDPGPPSAAP